MHLLNDSGGEFELFVSPPLLYDPHYCYVFIHFCICFSPCLLFFVCHSFSYPAQPCQKIWQFECTQSTANKWSLSKVTLFFVFLKTSLNFGPFNFYQNKLSSILKCSIPQSTSISFYQSHMTKAIFSLFPSLCLEWGKHCLNETNRKILHDPFMAEP